MRGWGWGAKGKFSALPPLKEDILLPDETFLSGASAKNEERGIRAEKEKVRWRYLNKKQ